MATHGNGSDSAQESGYWDSIVGPSDEDSYPSESDSEDWSPHWKGMGGPMWPTSAVAGQSEFEKWKDAYKDGFAEGFSAAMKVFFIAAG